MWPFNKKTEPAAPVITTEKAFKELESIAGDLAEIDAEEDKRLQLVFKTLENIKERLDKPDILKSLYLESPAIKDFIPETAYHLLENYIRGDVKIETAQKSLTEMIIEYKKSVNKQ